MSNDTQGTSTNFTEKEYFKFISELYPEDAFIVTHFKGQEGISELYDFEITFVTKQPESASELLGDETDVTLPPLSEMLLIHPAVFIIKHPDLVNNTNLDEYDDITSDGATYTTLFDQIKGSFKDTKNAYFYGFPVSCTQSTKVGEWTFYTVRLRPVFDKLNHITQNTVYTDKTVTEIVGDILDENHAIPIDYTFDSITTSFEKQEFTFQNNETSFNYISAKLAHDGIYYFYSQDNKLEQLIFMDGKYTHEENNGANTLYYQPLVSANDKLKGNLVTSFTEVRTAVPKTVFLRDYDWTKPNDPIQASATISSKGLGEVYLFGEGFTSEAEGTRLAELRAEEILCQSYNYIGHSEIPKLRPGYLFTMENHYSSRLNDEYMVTEVIHEGSQEAMISSIMGINILNSDNVLFYRNTFKSIPASIQYRPKRTHTRTQVSGLITAFVDSVTGDEGDDTLDLDEYGRYKVVFPQTTSGTNVSCMVRRAQPSVGPKSGSMYPIYPGTEVLIGFTNGHPDRPILISPVNNTETGFAGQNANGLTDINFSQVLLTSKGLSTTVKSAGQQITTEQDSISSYDNNTNIVNGLDTGFATLSTTAASSYSALLSANTNPLLLSLKLAGPLATSLGQAFSAADTNNHTWDILGLSLEALGKLLPSAFTIVSKTSAHLKGACGYRTSMTSMADNSTIALEANLNTYAFSCITASIVGHILTSIEATRLTNSSENSTMAQYDADIAAAQAEVDANADELAATQAALTEVNSKLENPTLTPVYRALYENQKRILTLRIEELEAPQETLEEKKYAKRIVKAHNIVPDVATIATEAVAFSVLIYTKLMQHLKPRGGIKIASADNNVAISGANEVSLASGTQVFIGANTALHTRSTAQLIAMYEATDSSVWGTGNPCNIPEEVNFKIDARVGIVSQHILSGAEKINRMISLDEITINSAKKITITNKSKHDIITKAEPLINVVGPKVPTANKPATIIKAEYPNSEITMDNNPQPAEPIFSIVANPDENTRNGLGFYSEKTELVFAKQTKAAGAILDDSSLYLSFSAGGASNQITTLTLEESTVTMEADATQVILDSQNKKVSLIADNATSIILNAGGDITTKAKTLTSTATGDVSITGKNVTVDGGTTLKLTSSGCDISANLTVGGSKVQLC